VKDNGLNWDDLGGTGSSNEITTNSITSLGDFALANSTGGTNMLQQAFYIDSIAGNDTNIGSVTSPWKNVSKLNALSFFPGAKIYLKCGSTWSGQQLKFSGSGVIGNPIAIDRYGTGADPVLQGNGLIGQGVVYLKNQQYIESFGDYQFT